MPKVIYELRKDVNHINNVQRASVHSSWAGFVSEHGLFGSEEWWNSIEEGRIPVHVLRGRITRVYMSGHNDYPEFEVDDGQSRTRWTRQGPDEDYVVGRTIQIEYVLQRFKDGTKTLRKMLGDHSQCVLQITITDEKGA